MTHTKITWMLGGGACLSLAMFATAVAQDADEAEAVEAVPVEGQVDGVVVEAEDITIVDIGDDAPRLVVVQDGDPFVQVDDAFRQQIIKELLQEGVPIEQIQQMLGGTVEVGPVIDAENTVVDAAPDGSALYLPLGTTKKFALERGTTLELPFVADGPGMLTVAYGGAVQTTQVEVVDASGRRLAWEDNSGFGGVSTSPVRHALIPIGGEGEFTIRLGALGEGELTLGGEWLPFPQVEGVSAVIVPSPEPTTEIVLVPDRMMTGAIDQSDPDRYHLWCRFEATEDGQLVVLANADQGDITMSSFNEGQYRNPIEHVDSDMNGSVANEGLIVDAVAGQVYYVRVEMRSGERCGVEVRAGWVPAAE
ncbi:hypothetical protein OT109_04355 [Phycisphaeraceae bacterium D3-23]